MNNVAIKLKFLNQKLVLNYYQYFIFPQLLHVNINYNLGKMLKKGDANSFISYSIKTVFMLLLEKFLNKILSFY